MAITYRIAVSGAGKPDLGPFTDPIEALQAAADRPFTIISAEDDNGFDAAVCTGINLDDSPNKAHDKATFAMERIEIQLKEQAREACSDDIFEAVGDWLQSVVDNG